ncbi:MAG: radical SAM protein [Magnetococcales bacterium]|nr:cobalamin-dependent protein [Magnetococcales bacterium]NGZ05110.1 radical SAM protein [Magnetococcales bacterium]
MKIALVHYNVNRIANEPGNKTVMKHFGHMPNIQLLYVAAVLEQIGVEIVYYDMVGMRMDESALSVALKRFCPDIIALSVYTSHFHQAKSFAVFFKELLPEVRILFGGVHMSIFPEETLRHCPVVDYGCVGEAEMVLPEFIRRLKANESLVGLLGLVWREGDRIHYSGPAPKNMDLDATPFPARHLVPNEVYFNFISTYRNYTVFNSSRGCPYPCIFCEAAQTRWRARSAENVVAEFEQCYEQHGIREVDIFDSSFTVEKQRVFDICQLLITKGLHKKMVWNVRSTLKMMNEELLEALREAGCYRIFYGVESGNEEILQGLRKPVKIERAERIIKKTAELGISTFGYFLIGAPGETPETARQTIDFAKRLPLDFAIFNTLVAFPETELYRKHYLPHTQNDFWADYLSQPKEVNDFMGRPWTTMGDNEMKQLCHSAMNEFYFRPVQIWRALRSVRSVDQVRRYAYAGVDMLKDYILRHVFH